MSSAVILAAGMGTRLGKYTKELPKCMLSFMGKTLLQRQVETLRAAGVTDISIVRGYHPEQIALRGVTYFENKDYATTNMVATLIAAREKLLAVKDSVLVCYADIIYEERLISTLLRSNAEVNVLVDDAWVEYWKARLDDWKSDVESLQYDDTDRLIEIGTPHCEAGYCQSRYIGLLKFSSVGIRALIRAFDENREQFWDSEAPWRKSKSFRKAYMTCMLQELIERGLDVKVVHTHGGWMEFDTVEDYEKALLWSKSGVLARFFNLGYGS